MKAICDDCGKEFESGKDVFESLFGTSEVETESVCDSCYGARRAHILLRDMAMIRDYQYTSEDEESRIP
jgi:hypothetical protein